MGGFMEKWIGFSKDGRPFDIVDPGKCSYFQTLRIFLDIIHPRDVLYIDEDGGG